MENDKTFWNQKLFLEGFTTTILLNKVVRTIIKENSFNSVLSWTDTILDVENLFVNHNTIFFANSIIDLLENKKEKYDLIVIESYKLIFSDDQIPDENGVYDVILTDILNNHLNSNGKLIILDRYGIVSGLSNPFNPYEDFETFCNNFRQKNSDKLEVSISYPSDNLSHDDCILVLNKKPCSNTFINSINPFAYRNVHQMISFFDLLYIDRSNPYWIENIYFLKSKNLLKENIHIKWHNFDLLVEHLNIPHHLVMSGEIGGQEIQDFWDNCFQNIKLKKNDFTLFNEQRHELIIFNQLVFNLINTDNQNNIFSSYFLNNYVQFQNYFYPKNIVNRLNSFDQIDEFDFSLNIYERFCEINLIYDCSFIENSEFDDSFNDSFKKSDKKFNIILIDYENDFEAKNQSTLLDLFLSFNESTVKEGSNIFILVKDDVLCSQDYISFRKEFSHFLYSIVKIKEEYMLWFKYQQNEKAYILNEKLSDIRLINSRIKNKKNFLIKSKSFFKDWLENNNLHEKPQADLKKIINKQFEDQSLLIKSEHEKTRKKIKSLIENLSKKFKLIKNDLSLNTDQKIDLLSNEIDSNIPNKISDKEEKIKKWISNWNLVDEFLTRTLMKQAEFLYDILKESNDLSPFVIQYSRAIENELLVKIFLPYHANFINENKDLDYMIRPKKEFISELNSDKRRKINFDLKYFKNHLEKDNNKYTLGTMLEILSLVQKKKYSFTHTMLLQDFRNFTLKKIDVFSNKELIENLKKLNKNFRVKSAHPNLLAVGESDEFYKLIKKIFNDFIDSIKM